jgi:hypothetical protein
MKMKALFFTISYMCLASICSAQIGSEVVAGQDSPATYLLDGERTSFAYGRAIAPNKIAIGLTVEGVYELRGDSAVWLVNHPQRQDECVCIITDDVATGNKLFVMTSPDRRQTPVDTICAYNLAANIVFDKAGKEIGTIQYDGRLVSPKGKDLLLNLQTVDKLMAAFFVAYHYTPVRKHLKFSYFDHPIRHYIYRYYIS